MKMILFSMYYCKLQLSVMLGIYKTANPLDLTGVGIIGKTNIKSNVVVDFRTE
jgi:hypothetical protein